MKKHGFTLAEVLIALGIIAVISALTAPSLTNLMPDKNKAKVIKLYSTLNSINQELLSNTSLYPGEWSESDQDGTYACEGFDCTGYVLDPTLRGMVNNISELSLSSKYPNLLRTKLEISEGADFENYKDKHTFTTIDGVKWIVEFGYEDQGGTFITFDLDSSDDSPDCYYNKTDSKKPDQFYFQIEQTGKHTPNDPLTYYFIKNQKLNNKKKDYEDAANGAGITFKSRTQGPNITLW